MIAVNWDTISLDLTAELLGVQLDGANEKFCENNHMRNCDYYGLSKQMLLPCHKIMVMHSPFLRIYVLKLNVWM